MTSQLATALHWLAAVERIAAQEMVEVRAGHTGHRPLPIWMVVVQDRVFVRSWRASGPLGWAAIMAREGSGAIRLAHEEIAVTAAPIRSPALNGAISDAYRAKYGRFVEVEDMVAEPSTLTTLELTPVKPETDDA